MYVEIRNCILHSLSYIFEPCRCVTHVDALLRQCIQCGFYPPSKPTMQPVGGPRVWVRREIETRLHEELSRGGIGRYGGRTRRTPQE